VPRLELLEDRLAPSLGLFGAVFLTNRETSLLPAKAHEISSPRLDRFRADAASHPRLALLLARRLNGLGHGDILPRFSLGGETVALPPPGVAPSQGSTATMIVGPQNQMSGSALSLRPAAGPARSDLAPLSNPVPPPGDGPGFSPFAPSVLMSPGKDRPRTFELSPYTPSGLDIVPVPVPSGPADRLADLFGSPLRDTAPDNLLGEGRQSDDAVRDAVSQMLRESWPPPGLLETLSSSPRSEVSVPLPSPASPEESHAPTTAAKSTAEVPALPVLSASNAEQETTAAEPPRRSMLAAIAAGLGLAGWHGWRRERRARRFSGDPAQAAPCL
jgi:hypothetical protein